ncbi:hypothetical protein GCM10023335_68110 [Streptomyces siamensis]|uniref:Transposase n=1 Tax=Streptomyces siamensis TaxID=1274986 RepID=A0ABP9JE51_9ACTN
MGRDHHRVLPADAGVIRSQPTPHLRTSAPIPTGTDAVADTARDVLEHTASLGTTIPWDRLYAQVEGLHELNEEQQRRALKLASARSRSAGPLTALITIDNAPHPHYRHPPDTDPGPAAPGSRPSRTSTPHIRPPPPPPDAHRPTPDARRPTPAKTTASPDAGTQTLDRKAMRGGRAFRRGRGQPSASMAFTIRAQASAP